jgi:hypothetical protein
VDPCWGTGKSVGENDECYKPPSVVQQHYALQRQYARRTPKMLPIQPVTNPSDSCVIYESGKLDGPPKCIHYNIVQPRPDVDQDRRPPAVEKQKKRLNWIFAILVLVVIIAFVFVFMCWRKTRGRSSSSDEDGGSPQYQPYNVQDPETAGGGGIIEKRSEYLSINYLTGLSTPKPGVPGAGLGQGMGGRRGSTSSQNSARSTISYGVGSNGRRLSVTEKMVLDRDWAQEHEFMNRLSHSQRSGTFHRIEQLATSQGTDSAGGVGALSMGPSHRSMSFDLMPVYPATYPTPRVEHAQVHCLQQEPSPPPNTPENQLPVSMSSLG